MGEAQRRQKAFTDWRASLSNDEGILADVSLSLFTSFIEPFNYTGGCYHITFLLAEYLRTKRNIEVTPIVGYINDGTDEIMISHAWIEYDCKKTDLTLAITEDVPPGPLLILDRAIIGGDCDYSYHLTEPAASRRASEKRGQLDRKWREAMIAKDAEHARMTGMVADWTLIREYLNSAPENLSFAAITSLLD